MTTLSVQQLSKTYHGNDHVVPTLSDISFSVEPGQFVSIVGPSGCGKSTLFNIIVGLDEPDTGEIRIDGQVMSNRTGLFGYMPQRDLLLPWRSILDDVTLGPELAGDDMKAKAIAKLPAVSFEPIEDKKMAKVDATPKRKRRRATRKDAARPSTKRPKLRK